MGRNEKLLQDPVRLRQISERIPAGRWGEPRDFAGPVVFLASAASQYVCGELLVVDGVRLLYLFLSLSFSLYTTVIVAALRLLPRDYFICFLIALILSDRVALGQDSPHVGRSTE